MDEATRILAFTEMAIRYFGASTDQIERAYVFYRCATDPPGELTEADLAWATEQLSANNAKEA